MDIAVVWNGAAGGCAGLLADDVVARISERTGRDAVAIEVTGERDPATCARVAIADGARILVAAGGDGTVSCCASALITAGVVDRTVLGVLPLGTSSSLRERSIFPSISTEQSTSSHVESP